MDEHGDVKMPKGIGAKVVEATGASQKYAYLMIERAKRKWRGKKPVKKLEDTPPQHVFSAVKDGVFMTIEEYCEHYRLPLEDIVEYKAVTHTATPYYNTKFRPKILEPTVNPEDFEEILQNYKPPKPLKVKKKGKGKIQRLIYTDLHIGLDPDPDGRALFPAKWGREEIKATIEKMATTLEDGPTIIVDDLGDYMDGWNGKTTRGGHDLEQGMDNREAYEVGLNMKRLLADLIAPKCDKLIFNNITNDNHSSDYSYTVCKAFKDIMEIQYPKKVQVTNHDTFISHYSVGAHCFIICHGKDDKHMNFGLKVVPNGDIIKRIRGYIDDRGINIFPYMEFSKGDSHQALFDMCSSSFDYFNYPAASPSSGYVQTNFDKGRRGFVIQSFYENNPIKSITPVFL